MVLFFPYVLALFILIITVIEVIRFWKNKKPEKIARKFAFIAVGFGIIHLFCDFFPFEYTGNSGIDYVGQAVAFGFFINAIIYSTLIVYLNFAAAATVYAVKAIKKNDKRKKSVLWLVLSWVCAIVVAGIVVTNIIYDNVQKNSIKVEVKEVTSATDYEGKPSVLIVLEFYNGTDGDLSFLSAVHHEVSQVGHEIYGTGIDDSLSGPDYELEPIKPGCSVEIRKAYELDDPDKPVRVLCSSYDGNVIYVDNEYKIN